MKKYFLPDLPLVFTALFAALAWMFCNKAALLSLHQRWTQFDQAYALGYPAIGLAIWWLTRHRKILHEKNRGPFWPALVLLAGALLAGIAGTLMQLQLLSQLAALASLLFIILLSCGWRVASALLFPAALLLLAIPLWDFLVDPLRGMTVWFTQHVLDWLHIPAFVDGYFITLPAGVVEVADGCSGLNLLLAMALVGLMFVESHLTPVRRRFGIFLLALMVGLIDNWVRVLLLVLIAHFTDMQSELVQHHGNFGWWVFAIGLLPYFWLATRLEGRGHSASVVAVDASSRSNAKSRYLAPLVAGVLMLMVWMGGEQLQQHRGSAMKGIEVPLAATQAPAQWLAEYHGHDVVQTWRVPMDGRVFELTAMTYVEQRADKKLIYYSNRIAGEGRSRYAGRVELAPGYLVNTALLDDGGRRQVWWFWWVDGSTSTSALRTKLLQLRAMLLGDPSAALITLSAPCDNQADCMQTLADPDAATRQLLLALRETKIAR